MKYKYHLRPGYQSQKLLIEIFSGAENEDFFPDFFDSIIEINPKVVKINELWMNDEYLLDVNSDIGSFSISKDIWDLAFIMSEDNQECLNKINLILLKDQNFQKVEVNFDDYKLKTI
ncbi:MULTISPECIES: hypothetical protein [unclassified Flavobacterium]|jgi:hypothetical protein|uniref:hypothetical protein n=1 Tax=unclassified Flavobacterium TaxID=196869 RepID=UPI0012A9CA60|nr:MULTISPECIES: hypothetical protein [unclassified Flavobacterium]MBF4483659.1 hypothetical protein [Flavobacterium sp. CSZ]QGK76224.1 hypothetical protein GIY83_19775 [Flavobacterium sp. SLB02]